MGSLVTGQIPPSRFPTWKRMIMSGKIRTKPNKHAPISVMRADFPLLQLYSANHRPPPPLQSSLFFLGQQTCSTASLYRLNVLMKPCEQLRSDRSATPYMEARDFKKFSAKFSSRSRFASCPALATTVAHCSGFEFISAM